MMPSQLSTILMWPFIVKLLAAAAALAYQDATPCVALVMLVFGVWCWPGYVYCRPVSVWCCPGSVWCWPGIGWCWPNSVGHLTILFGKAL